MKDKTMSQKIPVGLWESLGADITTINNKHYLCIVVYHSIFPMIKQVEGFCADNLIKTSKIIFSEYGLSSKTVSDEATNYISEKFKNHCR